MTTRKASSPAPNRPQTLDQHPAGKSPQAASLQPWMKSLLSALLLFHLTAVFWAPFAFASDTGGTSSPFAESVAAFFRPYITALHLDHGYFFFAPNPGPSHLVDYKVEFEDSRPPVHGRFPNLAKERPRLLYHRHFMLAEALNNNFIPAEAPPEPSPPALTASKEIKARFQLERAEYVRDLARWRLQRTRYERMKQSFEEHLKAEYGGSQVTLTRVEHANAQPWEVSQERKPLDSADSYRNLPEVLPRGVSR